MALSVRNPADVVNLALVQIGYRDRVAWLGEGSKAARAARDIYSQTRDAVLRMANWGFAERIAAAVLSGQPAPAPWSVSYAYPADCLRVRNLFGPAYLADKNNPVRALYTIANDVTAGKVIFSNTVGATLVYTRQVTSPLLWEPLFIEMLANELGKGLALALASGDAAKMAMEGEKAIVPLAEDTLG